MAYTPTEWKTGDIITAEKLNKAEQGIKDAHDAADISSGGGSNIFYIYALGDADEGVITGLSKTYQEIYEAVFDQEKLPVFVDLDGHHYQYDRSNSGFEFLNLSFGFDSPDKINSIIARWFRIKSDGTYETKYGYRSFS